MSSPELPGEFLLINHLQKKVTSPNEAEVVIGIGDDCAVLHGTEGKYLLVTTDMLIEDVHFSRLYSPLHQIGQKAIIVNLSDIAAMGGKPKFAFISLALPPSLSFEDFDELTQGLIDAAQKYSVFIAGGDTNASFPYAKVSSADKPPKVTPSGLVINITLLGEIEPKNVITRRGARQGDFILLTGQIGDSSAGLDILRFVKGVSADKNKIDLKKSHYLQTIQRHQVPVVRLAEAQLISENHLATAMIDVSDGLAGDLRHICRQGKVGAILWCDRFPISKAVKDIARLFRKSHLTYALAGGEDYELLFTCPPDHVEKAQQLIEQGTGTAISIIGEITEKENDVRLIDSHGQTLPLPESGFDHFHK